MLLEFVLPVSLTFAEQIGQIFRLIADLLLLLSTASPVFLIYALDIVFFAVYGVVFPTKELLLLCASSIYSALVQPVYLSCSSALSLYGNSVICIWVSSTFWAILDHCVSVFSSTLNIITQCLHCSAGMVSSSTQNLSKSILSPIVATMKEYTWKATFAATVCCIIAMRLAEMVWDALYITCMVLATSEDLCQYDDMALNSNEASLRTKTSSSVPTNIPINLAFNDKTLSAIIQERDTLSAKCAKLDLKCIWLHEECDSLQKDNDALDEQNKRLFDDYQWATRFIQKLVTSNARAGRDPKTYALYMLFEDGTREYAHTFDAEIQKSETSNTTDLCTSSSITSSTTESDSSTSRTSPASTTSALTSSSSPPPATSSETSTSSPPPSSGEVKHRNRKLRRAGPSISISSHSRSSSSESSKSTSSCSSNTTLADTTSPSPPLMTPSEKLAAARMASPFVREFLARSCGSPRSGAFSPTTAVYCS